MAVASDGSEGLVEELRFGVRPGMDEGQESSAGCGDVFVRRGEDTEFEAGTGAEPGSELEEETATDGT